MVRGPVGRGQTKSATATERFDKQTSLGVELCSVNDSKRLLWARSGGLSDLAPKLLGRLIHQYIEKVVFANLEHFWRRTHTQCVRLAQFPIHLDSHFRIVTAVEGN
jgi:hypothetical protein